LSVAKNSVGTSKRVCFLEIAYFVRARSERPNSPEAVICARRSIRQSGLTTDLFCAVHQWPFSAISRKNWTSARRRAVVFALLILPGNTGLHSVQGERLAFAERVEKTMTIEIKQEPKVANIIAIKAKPKRQEQLSKLLNRKSGATILQIQSAFGWQPHTARAALSKLHKPGTAIERSDTDKGSVYRIVSKA
jgi:hypothetical protein